MYEAGKSRSEVLTAIYGVDLPREAVLIHRDYVLGQGGLRVIWKTNPWQLMIPLDKGGPKFEIGEIDCEDDVRAYAQAPNVVLVAWLGYPNIPRGFSLIGYDLDEVAAGRSTVVGLPQQRQVPLTGAQFTVFGPSLIDVFSDMITGYRSSRADREDRGALEDRNHASGELAGIEALRHELAQE